MSKAFCGRAPRPHVSLEEGDTFVREKGFSIDGIDLKIIRFIAFGKRQSNFGVATFPFKLVTQQLEF